MTVHICPEDHTKVNDMSFTGRLHAWWTDADPESDFDICCGDTGVSLSLTMTEVKYLLVKINQKLTTEVWRHGNDE